MLVIRVTLILQVLPDLIQVFVEALDKNFENVCELDLIFHPDKVNYILDEIIMAGMVLETNIHHILTAVNDQNKLHSSALIRNSSTSVGSSASHGPTAASQVKDIGEKFLSTISGGLR